MFLWRWSGRGDGTGRATCQLATCTMPGPGSRNLWETLVGSIVLSASFLLHLGAKDMFSALTKVQVSGPPLRCRLTRDFPARGRKIPEDLVHLTDQRVFGCELKSGC